MKIAVGIATSGRRAVLSEMLDYLARQIRTPDAIYLCPASDDDIDLDIGLSLDLGVPVHLVHGERGLCAQRNAILDAAAGYDLISFFDDDFLPKTCFLSRAERLFTDNSDIVVATGKVLADGIHGAGLSVSEAVAILEADVGDDANEPHRSVFNAYGCNMTFRMTAILDVGARFDENLPLYGWQEDVDFCRRLPARGTIVRCPALRGVHLGHKSGRISGLRFGYSQVANPLYLVGKGTVGLRWALRLMACNVGANILGSLASQTIIDRRGRLKGNLIAISDLLLRRLRPQRILEIGSAMPKS
ncbi:glycosyltransferase family 2 protein [Rhizobium tubonense]|uniref:Glucosyll transferase family 2 n=1 Tax=Rhizobium tubonense TaxID=484088 RepID=A0A2W4E700_9HYPH|nr:glucosyll transferase family 2 [Rhizobium tubonense]PZM07610.1 glucosyll transferase family 2 [Rhizobium tubonense]